MRIIHENDFGFIFEEKAKQFVLGYDDQLQFLSKDRLHELRKIILDVLNTSNFSKLKAVNKAVKKKMLNDFLELLDWACLRTELFDLLEKKSIKN
jgi:hypothetical protein